MTKLKKRHPLYRRWTAMRQACYNPRSADYRWAGALGIRVHWHEFWDFVNYVERYLGIPPNLDYRIKLHRPDIDRDYCPGNLQWTDSLGVGQHLRRALRIRYQGRNQTLSAWSRELGINYSTLNNRVHYGWTPAQILGFEPSPRAGRA